ncbi:MAG: hypothetical protein IH968_11640 [Gemmatimonadetes bacterium]|nr:hypothetical protein [Gemmatimonadota bacterium]
MVRGLSWGLVALLAALPTVAEAQTTRVVEVPPEISSPDQERLTGKRKDLRGRIDVLNSGIDALNSRCGSVAASDHALRRECMATQGALTARQNTLENEVALFRIEVIEATRRGLATCESEVAAAQKIINEARRDLTRYLGSQSATDIEAWANLPLDARAEARSAAVDAVLSMALDALSLQDKVARGVTDHEITQVREVVRDYGPLFDRIQPGLSRQLTLLGTDAEFFEAVGQVKTRVGIVNNMISDKSDQEKALTGVAQLLGIFVKNPTAKMLLTDINIWTPILYTGLAAYHADARVRQLEELTELDLRAVSSLSSLTVRQVDRRTELNSRCERTLAALSRFATA